MTQPAPSRSSLPRPRDFLEAVEPGLMRSLPAAAGSPFQLEPLPTSSPFRLGETGASAWQSPPAQPVPLRGRDLQVLTDLFNQHEIEAIESDILHNLDRRCPEPCWEDDPFEFLREYL